MAAADENITDENITDESVTEEGHSPEGDDALSSDAGAGADGGVDGELADGEPEVDEVQRLSDENKFLLDQVQRSRAELENFRRRTADERIQLRTRLTSDVIRRVLPLYDNLMLAVRNKTEGDKLLEGIRIIAADFEQVLADFQIEAIPAVGEPFDPNWHEAMFQQETDEFPEGQVLEEFERGYRMGEGLIRPARVKVSKAPAESSD